MKNLKPYIIALLILISTVSFAQQITINTKEATTFLLINDIQIGLKQQVFIKTTSNGVVTYKLNDDVPNVIANVKSNLKFLLKNKNKNLEIKIIKLSDKKSIKQDRTSFDDIKNEIDFKLLQKEEGYFITIPEIEKGIYAIIVNNSTTCNVFEIN